MFGVLFDELTQLYLPFRSQIEETPLFDYLNLYISYFIYYDNMVLNTGILQYGEYTTNKNQYETNINIVQYNPN